MKYFVAVFPFVIMAVVLMSLRGVFPKPDVTLSMGTKSYDFTNRIAYADMYLVKGTVEECDEDTCYQEHTVKVYYLKKDVVTNTVVEKGQTSTHTIAASTTSTTTFIGKLIINDYNHYYEYYVAEGKSYKAVNTTPVTLRYFPNKHLSTGHYAIQFGNDSCFKNRIEIFRGNSATENAKTLNHRVRVYYKVGINGETPEGYATVFDADKSSITESVIFANTHLKECNHVSFFEVTDVEIEQ
jgi:hypothetical protein